MEEVLIILQEINDDIDYTKEKNLVSDKLFVSFDIIQCVAGCEERFGVEIPAEMIIPENFESAESIWKMICILKGKNE